MIGRKQILMAGVVAMVSQAPIVAKAATSNLAPQVNGDIRGGAPDRSFDGVNSGNYLAVINDDGTVAGAAKAYLRFQLPADFAHNATAVSFSISRAASVSVFNLPYFVFGLNDGTAGETTFTEDTGTSTDLTFNNAPGNDTSTTSGFVNSMQLGSFTALGSRNGGMAGDTFTLSGSTLVDFINADTNGLVTFEISQDPNEVTSSENLFASDSNTTYSIPSLQLTYTSSTPEPASLALFGVAVPMLLGGRRRRR